jgi:hypothetical protein
MSLVGPDSPHLSGQRDNPKRITLILNAGAVARPSDYDIKSDLPLSRTARVRCEHRRDRSERNGQSPWRTVQQVRPEENHERNVGAEDRGQGSGSRPLNPVPRTLFQTGLRLQGRRCAKPSARAD